MATVKRFSTSIIIAGFIILMIGAYYGVVEAGIPYQDPPTDLQIQYAVNTGVSDVLVECGGIVSIAGLLIKAVATMIAERGDKK